MLLVEDNDVNAEIAVKILSHFGATADRAENGRIGLEMILERGDGWYDAVLMDIQMPVMNGYKATRAIRAADKGYCKTLPVIAMSANAYDEDVRECLAAGMNAHLAKPFNPADLLKLLHEQIRENRFRDHESGKMNNPKER